MSPDVAASIKARLLNQAKAHGEEFERTLTRFAAERLIYRIGASPARRRCLLKGASLLSVWLPDRYRETRDVDVLAFGASDDGAVAALLEGICAVPCPEDGLRFDLSGLKLEVIRPEEEHTGKRARFLAYLGGARIHVQVDVAFGDVVGAEPEEVEHPTMLERLPAPRLRAYPREASIAEKFEAMVKLDTRNSRMKDFHDVWALSTSFAFDGPSLHRAITACFAHRGTPWTAETPRPLTPAFYQMDELAARWRNYLAAGAVLVPPPGQFEVIGDRIIRFLGPLRHSIVAGAPFTSRWNPEGPWR
jgi:hypothetical protein